MLDAVCLLIAIVVIDTLGSMAKGGTQTLTRLATLTMLFLVPAGLVIADPDVYLPDGFAGDRLGVLLAELLPLAAVVDAAERQRSWKCASGCESGHCPTAQTKGGMTGCRLSRSYQRACDHPG